MLRSFRHSGVRCCQRRTARTGVMLCLLYALLVSGCFHPGFYYGYPYGQPAYAPPRTLNQGSPGSLTIPESGDSPYIPGRSSDYDLDPDKDDFNSSEDNEDDVPFPSDRRAPFYGEGDDLGTSIDRQERGQEFVARPVSGAIETRVPLEYGFDTAEYRWLRGLLRFDPSDESWHIVYSAEARDRYAGVLRLSVSPDALHGLQDGDPIDVRGHVENADTSSGPVPVYRVTDIRLMATRVAS